MDNNKVERTLLKYFLFGLFEISLDPKYIIGIYKYGSRLYETDHEDSDLDYCIIIDNDAPLWGPNMQEYVQFESDDMDLHIMSKSHYEDLLDKCDIMALECYYQEEPILKCDVEFKLELSKLRKSISSTVNLAWVKAKKKISIEEEDSKIGMKSLYHSFRILAFGIQIAKYGIIKNYITPPYIRDTDIENIRNPKWEYWNEKLKPKHNSMMTEFRKLAPKE